MPFEKYHQEDLINELEMKAVRVVQKKKKDEGSEDVKDKRWVDVACWAWEWEGEEALSDAISSSNMTK